VRWALTLNLVALAWIVYRAGSLAEAGEVLGRLATGAPGAAGVVTALAAAVVAVAVAGQVAPDHHTVALRARFSSLRPAAQAVLLALGLTLVAALAPGTAPFTRLPF
jgi:hypothetical protein